MTTNPLMLGKLVAELELSPLPTEETDINPAWVFDSPESADYAKMRAAVAKISAPVSFEDLKDFYRLD